MGDEVRLQCLWQNVLWLLCLCVAACDGGSGGQQGSLRVEDGPSELLVSNDWVTMVFSKTDGTLLRLEDGRGTALVESGTALFAVMLASTGDVWQAVPETVVLGAGQSAGRVEAAVDDASATVTIGFDSLVHETTSLPVGVTLEIEVRRDVPQTLWRIAIDNGSDRVVVGTAYPLLGHLETGRLGNAVLTRPYMAGLQTRLADLTGATNDHYPHRLSMPWYDLSGDEGGLYLAVVDPDPVPHASWFRFEPAEPKIGPAVAVVRMPFLAPATSWTGADAVLAIHPGDWHAAARMYRDWFESRIDPIEVSDYAASLPGLGSVHLKTPWNMDHYDCCIDSFLAILDFLDTAEHRDLGVTGFRLDGWHENGYDTFVPGYAPLEKLGGRTGWQAALEAAADEGLRVFPYVNTRLINQDDALIDTYDPGNAALRKQCALRTVDGGVVTETYNGQTGVVMCPSCPAWMDALDGVLERLVTEDHVPGLFLDQFALGISDGLLCYNPDHGHPTPADVWGRPYLELAKRIHELGRAADPDFLIYIEGIVDRFTPYVDLPYTWTDETVFMPGDGSTKHPMVFRYTFPDLGRQKLYGHGTSDGTGLLLLIGAVLDGAVPGFSRMIDRAPDVLRRGTFLDTDGLTISTSDTMIAAAIRGENDDKLAAGILLRPGQTGRPVDITLDLAEAGLSAPPTTARALALDPADDLPLDFDVQGSLLHATYDGPLFDVAPVFVLFE